jgi:hypothetical protein
MKNDGSGPGTQPGPLSRRTAAISARRQGTDQPAAGRGRLMTLVACDGQDSVDQTRSISATLARLDGRPSSFTATV